MPVFILGRGGFSLFTPGYLTDDDAAVWHFPEDESIDLAAQSFKYFSDFGFCHG
jgi:hypothetical protein